MLRGLSRTLRYVGSQARRIRRDDSGSVLTMLVVIPVLVGTVAIGVETGQLYRVKRQMQSAADAAAVAGSIDRVSGAQATTITTDARYAAQRNGFTNGTSGVVVTVNSPPASGSNINATGAVEVIVTKPQSFSLGNVIFSWMGATNSGFTMRARSVAAQSTYTSSTTISSGCIVALTTAAEQGVSFTSFNNMSSDCAIVSNGGSTTLDSNASVYMANFNNATLSPPSGPGIWARGSFRVESYSHLTATTQTNQTGTAVDPYATGGTKALSAPSPGACTYTNYVEPSGTDLTLSPGVYCGGLSVTSKNNVYFTPGTYYIADGDLVIRANNNVSCTGCTTASGITPGTTFVLTQKSGNNSNIGGVSITSMNNVTLNAPSGDSSNNATATYPYPGVLFYQDRNATVGTMTSTAKIFTLSSLNNATLYGAIYFPNNLITISSINNSGGTSTTGCTVWIGRYIKFSSYNNTYTGGCGTYGTTAAGITTSTTVTKPKVLE